MNLRILSIVLLFPLAASAQTTRPATTKPVWASLAGGEIRYTQPVGWKALPNATDTAASFQSPDGTATVTLQATPEQQPLPATPSVAHAVGQQILKAITDDLAKNKTEVLDPPKLKPAPRIFVRIHDKVRVNDTPTDRLHLYRPLGYFLLMATLDTTNPDPAQIKADNTTAEDLLAGTILGKREPATRPTPKKRT